MKKVTEAVYFTVRVDVEYPHDMDRDEMLEELHSGVNYSFKYRRNKIKVIDTEICDSEFADNISKVI